KITSNVCSSPYSWLYVRTLLLPRYRCYGCLPNPRPHIDRGLFCEPLRTAPFCIGAVVYYLEAFRWHQKSAPETWHRPPRGAHPEFCSADPFCGLRWHFQEHAICMSRGRTPLQSRFPRYRARAHRGSALDLSGLGPERYQQPRSIQLTRSRYRSDRLHPFFVDG